MSMATPSVLYCTDEDVAKRMLGDFMLCVPPANIMARGDDGEFLADNRWGLVSASVNFAARGVLAGQVAFTKYAGGKIKYEDLLAVDSVETTTLGLRRFGQTQGYGEPPGPINGTSSVQFLIPYLKPQIQLATSEINRIWNIGELWIERPASSLVDPSEIRELCVLWVMRDLYFGKAKEQTAQSPWWVKHNKCQEMIASMKDRMDLTFSPLGSVPRQSIKIGHVER
jgi:hypothetical protein